MTHTDDLPDLLTVNEAAEYLRVPPSWVYARTRLRAIPVRKVGNLVRIPKVQFLQWIQRDGVAA